ncbi:MAG TPA: OsmC family protein [Saprospiraceae bacterium]|nr:OsmC family protein [Saprospiraceae bacterium]
MAKKTISLEYQGQLSCHLVHEQSGTDWTTDAPVDNQGLGRSFSPTDALAASLGSCYMTIMGIAAQKHKIDIEGASMTIGKYMRNDPRRVHKVRIRLTMPDKNYSEKQKAILINAGRSCPVSRSLHPEMIIDFQITWH